uniref:Putative kunitz n=1 Tax=Rhipicephalus microplus TaxID=6941 RepID=A0A6G5A792_RHIMP
MIMNTCVHDVITFFIIMHGMVLKSDGSEKFQFWKYRHLATTNSTTRDTMNTTGGTPFNTSKCFQEPTKGICRAHLQRWYYNSSSGNCSVFYYGGCGGNENRFFNCQECMGNCGFQNVSETASNITAICNQLEEAADEYDSWEHQLI